MRRIRFKARSLKTNEMVEGYYVLTNIARLDSENRVIGFDNNHCIFCDEPGCRNGSYWVEIDPDTLCQQTGMDDMYMMPIWEHDIVKLIAPKDSEEASLHEQVAEVIFHQTAYYLHLDCGYNYQIAVLRGIYDMQVIGNIYETET